MHVLSAKLALSSIDLKKIRADHSVSEANEIKQMAYHRRQIFSDLLLSVLLV
jgi:hypothetical protein